MSVLERWRERCRRATRKDLPRGIDSLNSELAITKDAPSEIGAERMLVRYGGIFGISKKQKQRLRLALRWLREEMERGDGHE